MGMRGCVLCWNLFKAMTESIHNSGRWLMEVGMVKKVVKG